MVMARSTPAALLAVLTAALAFLTAGCSHVATTPAEDEEELVSAEDRAAVLDWRLDASGMRNAGTGPLPWMPGVPERLADDPHWGAYLDQRAHLVDLLADEVRGRAAAQTSLPTWAQNGIRPDTDTVATEAAIDALLRPGTCSHEVSSVAYTSHP